jgi:hypothetical protein
MTKYIFIIGCLALSGCGTTPKPDTCLHARYEFKDSYVATYDKRFKTEGEAISFIHKLSTEPVSEFWVQPCE